MGGPEGRRLGGGRSPVVVDPTLERAPIRRTASLDAAIDRLDVVDAESPTDSPSYYCDKATQTEEHPTPMPPAAPPVEDRFDKFLRHRLQRPAAATSQSRAAATTTTTTLPPTMAKALRARSSVEGLNQEIERLVLARHNYQQQQPQQQQQSSAQQQERRQAARRSSAAGEEGGGRGEDEAPEGHRAPLAELLRRSVNTQTPANRAASSSSGGGPPSRESPATGGGGGSGGNAGRGSSPERRLTGGSVCSSPDLDGNRLGTSPHINRFLAREPPDGCEKVNLKFTESSTSGAKSIVDLSPIKPSVGFQLRPSLGSAFQPLQPAFVSTRSPSDDER